MSEMTTEEARRVIMRERDRLLREMDALRNRAAGMEIAIRVMEESEVIPTEEQRRRAATARPEFVEGRAVLAEREEERHG